ncbi:MAG: adenylate/guanylate cyclase domain-containing protein [Fimbriimonadaceae bacterium]|nr:adenylate/guanylate cyclase domain-containing protein [Fimbriimonadaceae bacterium]
MNETPSAPDRTVLAAILFTDAVGFSAFAREDEAGALEAIAADHRAMRTLCGQHDGKVVKSTGDGLMMMFDSAVSAFQCALAILRDVPHSRIKHRLGLHLGDVTVSEDDVMGDGVNVASRLQELAQPGEICASQTVVDVVQSRLKFAMRPMGVQTLKNIPQPLRVYAVDPFGSETRKPHPPRLNARVVGFVFGAIALLAIGIPLWMLALRPPPQTVAQNESGPVTLSPELARYLENGKPVDGTTEAPAAQTPEEKALAKKVSDLESMQKWFDEQMKAYPKEKPLTLPATNGSKPTQVWKDETSGVVAKSSDDSRPDGVKAGTFVEATRKLIGRMPEGPQKESMLRKLESLAVPRKPPTSTPGDSAPPAPMRPGFVRNVPLPKEVQARIEELDNLNVVLGDALKGFSPTRPFSLESPGRQPLSLWIDADGDLVGDTGDGSAAPVEMATYIRVARELSKSLPDGPEKEALKAALEKFGHRDGPGN